jgi:type III restriction enzyme
VNQQGERLRGFDIDTLTAIATQRNEKFAKNLQKEIEHDTGIHFGVVEKHQFAAIPVTSPDGTRSPWKPASENAETQDAQPADL